MKIKKISATNLRLIMIITMFSILALAIVSFFFVQQKFYIFALDISAKEKSSDIIKLSPQEIKTLETKIDSMVGTISKMLTIAVPSQNYQTEATNDIKKYANDSGILINDNFSFTRPVNSSSTQLLVGEMSTQPIIITFSNPVNYNGFIKFLRLIETNLPKMQVAGISISRIDGSTDINVDPITIEVYTR